MSKRTSGVSAFVISAVLASCSVSEEDLIGTWVMTSDSRQFLQQEYKSSTPSFTLNDDGTLIAINFLFRGPSGGGIVQVSANGHWELTRAGDQAVRLRTDPGGTSDGSSSILGAQLFVSQGLLSVELVHYWGDPDTGRGVSFRKKD